MEYNFLVVCSYRSTGKFCPIRSPVFPVPMPLPSFIPLCPPGPGLARLIKGWGYSSVLQSAVWA